MVDMEVAQVEFLWKAMSVIPQNNQSNVLKCHLMSKCKSLHDKGDVRLPIKYIQKSSMCQFCSNIWRNGKYSLKILPGKVPTKSIKKILARFLRNPNSLRKFEVGLAKKYAQKKNTLVIKCGMCLKETKIDMIKPTREKKSSTGELPKEPQMISKKKKKKWVRDPSAGLRIPSNLLASSVSASDNKRQKLNVNGSSTLDKSGVPELKKNENTSSKEASYSEVMGVIPVNNKKRRNVLQDNDSSLQSIKKVNRLKIENKPETFKKDHNLMKLVKSNKLGNLLSNSKNISESPLSKFLSNL